MDMKRAMLDGFARKQIIAEQNPVVSARNLKNAIGSREVGKELILY